MQKKARLLMLTTLLVLLAVLAYGFAAQNTVPASYAGDGQAAVSGYTVSNVHYTLNASNPSIIDSVSFDLDQSASEVHAALGMDSNQDGTVDSWEWVTCSVTGGTAVSCDYTGATDRKVLDIIQLRVIASQ